MSKNQHKNNASGRTQPSCMRVSGPLNVVGLDKETLEKIHDFVTKYPEAFVTGAIVGDRRTFLINNLEIWVERVTDEMRQAFLSVSENAWIRTHDENSLTAVWSPSSDLFGPKRPSDSSDPYVGTTKDFPNYRGEKVELKKFGSRTRSLLDWPSSTQPTEK